jgi:hypothetical protein
LPAPSLELTAQELFTQANETRRHGDAAAAVRQYIVLERRFPRSPEASLSLVSLGRLYLDRLGDPARALAQFDEYLAAGGDGELRVEALVGRALALQRLGQRRERARRTLLAAFPNSLSADRATASLPSCTDRTLLCSRVRACCGAALPQSSLPFRASRRR